MSEDKELSEMEEMLKQLGPVIPAPEVDLREEILKNSKERWNQKRIIPFKLLAACAALLIFAAGIHFYVNQNDSMKEVITEEDGKDIKKDELKKTLDKTLKGGK